MKSNFELNDIIGDFFYFDDGINGKQRPVLIARLKPDSIGVGFAITSQYDDHIQTKRQNYYKLIDWKQEGLVKQSYIDFGSGQAVDLTLPHEYYGHLSNRDILGLINAMEEQAMWLQHDQKLKSAKNQFLENLHRLDRK